MNKGKKTLLAVVVGAVIIIAISTALILSQTSYSVLYRGLSDTEGAEIYNLLIAGGSDVKLERDGTILVPKEEEASIKMQLASEGYPRSALGYDIFTDSSDLMTTDFERKKYLIFQLQNRLQDAIKTLKGVKSAIVTLSVSDDDSFVLKEDKRPSTASVVLDLFTGIELNTKQINGIEELVAKSVPGLLKENVVIIDGDGEVLQNNSSDEGAGLASTQLAVVDEINMLFKNKIIGLLEPVFGKSGVSVAVNVVVDFDKKLSEETVFTPVDGSSGIISKQDSDKSSTNGGAISQNGTGTDVPTYQGQADSQGSSSASESVSTEYLVNKLIQSIQSDGGNIKDMTVAVMINSKGLPDETIEKYRQLIAYSAGIDQEKVVVTYAEFKAAPEAVPYQETSDDLISNLLDKTTLIYAGAALLFLIILMIIFSVLNRKRRKRVKLRQQEADPKQHRTPASAENIPGEIVLNETREQGLKKSIKEFTSTNPEIVAQLLRVWLKEDGRR
ncbi:MAG: flagellar basal-body MS-ring/collar protein FliF [Eubacteriales bacterium]